MKTFSIILLLLLLLSCSLLKAIRGTENRQPDSTTSPEQVKGQNDNTK